MKKLDIYLANIAVGNVLLHNLHWNVRGFAFKQVHEYLEGLYDEGFEYFDQVAEIQKQMGVDPKASMKDYLELATVKELPSKDIDQKDAIKEALNYYKQMKDLALEVREKADEEDKFLVANLMEDHIEHYVKEIWFMESMLK